MTASDSTPTHSDSAEPAPAVPGPDWSPDIARLQGHDDSEWLQVERSFCGRLQAYAQRRTGDVQAAEDIVQETLLGAVRGIPDFDPTYSFEQFLFGICRNRTIDHLRRRRARAIQVSEDEDGTPGLDSMVRESETPSAIVRGIELSERARGLLGEILRDWVEETWAAGEFVRLAVIEALFSGGWRNRDTWKRFGLRDETAVAGIKFRALKRLRQLAAVRESGSDLLRLLAAAEEGHRLLDMDVQEIWRERRVSCPARHWLALASSGGLEEGPAGYIKFHLEDMRCPWCLANRDDLSDPALGDQLRPLLERLERETLDYLNERRDPV
ncbi:RNA polymerase sigma factor [Engelhardtia mirabilis]|uniref:ECF RNA polymerase sigma factor SigL n=1 Tax=Engelhardtia mirabilis TaxID=2528011 RepID=A0A518BJ46_9BACT|nr:ECF RNA polymerase sigma factor SigL [Planctomycetes bacterium Pla133]QDV01321.1 ECF RNA polymerase sigma factor SigL [Planctomycetes bacterium Pla86]